MMDFKSKSLLKLADKLIKSHEAKEHFDKSQKEKEYSKKIIILKEILTTEYKFAIQHKVLHPEYNIKLDVIRKHIDYIKKIQAYKTLDTSDKQIVDQLMNKYGV
jgi:hypothetical protein